jgi:DNA polymerase I
LIFDTHKDEIELLTKRVDELMCSAIPLPVKIQTGIGMGSNWLEAH